MPDQPVLKIMTSVALKGVIEHLAPEFARATGYGFSPTYAPAGVVVKRMREGASADVVIVTPESFAVLVSEGHAASGSDRIIARSVIGMAVRAGAPHPAIGTAEQFRQALIDARSVAYTDPSTGAASGVHFAALLDRFGIADAVQAKAKLGDGGPVAEFVARGEAEIAIQQICEHMLVPGVDVVGPIPAELNKVTTFTGGVAAKSAAARESTALLELLFAPHIQGIMPRHGLEPSYPPR